MSRLLKRRRFVPLLLGDPEFAGDGDDDGGGSGGTTPGDELLPDPVIVADAVPSMRIAQHSEYEAANDWEHGAQWTVTNAGTWTDPSGGATGYMRAEPAAGAIAGRDTILADWYADHNPVFNCFVFPQTITNMRYFVGFTNLTLANQLALRIPAGIYFGFVFDSAVDTYWSCVCSDGVGYTEQPGTVIPYQVLRSIMRADLDVGVDARFYIDGIRMALITENLPPAGTAMRLANGMINTDGAVTQPCGFLFEQAGSIGGGL